MCVFKKKSLLIYSHSNVLKIVHGWVNKDWGTSNHEIGKPKISLGELVTLTMMNRCESENVSNVYRHVCIVGFCDFILERCNATRLTNKQVNKAK